MTASVKIFHNVVWSRHKGAVFTALHDISAAGAIRYSMVQIADTEHDRVGFSDVDYSFHRYPMQKLFDGCYEDVPMLRMVRRLVWEVFSAKADLIVLPGYHRPEYWAMLAACIVTGKRRAVFCDSTGRDRPRRLHTSIAKRLFFSFCDGYFGFGERSREYLMSLGAKREKIFVPCQAAALPGSFSPERALVERARYRDGNPPVFLFVGRLSGEKGISTLLEAFARLYRRIPEVRLRLVGTGPQRAQLDEQVAALGIGGAVTFLGSLQDEPLSREYYGATCLVLPSRSEPWGLVVNEALSHGCPAVVSESCGCVPELVIDGVSGYTFPAGDAAALQRTMRKAMEAFVDAEGTARRCMDVICRFDPPSAAANIARGCALMLGG
ncbi:glycosyltransferase family 4 protein [Paraburkholderia caballeronis]|uniref:glycosyltransferase family 4 protein n=1 Tax=Paraburkholderia caballeronis TaxID=416943 RepID=UPI001065C25C|nr:glycosyltransferase family 4 protein [Paraburkholderia caballeronis]TDV18258.1 glycosyltransferase involved in cell wall biosynthesis [Paraburkholderia caballeronis]TDV20204.1 glycosyltransferase involved in cell wall biosynthesis [Paraburkholderia caballeronis]TDV28421.1 glycosyltransferase involved in cell wall biosynthesis [Paraburkholderia caballeronis]